MPNIAITTYCNLHCPYCFANNMITTEQIKNISLEQFQKILNWLGPIDNDKIGLIGGEPTLHPEFLSILKLVENFNHSFPTTNFTLFTNGVYLDKYIQEMPRCVQILINVNTPTAMQPEQYERMIENIKTLSRLGWLNTKNNNAPRVTIGCNICQEIDDYDFFWNIVKKFEISEVRMSITAPTKEKHKKNKFVYYFSMKEKLLKFVQNAKLLRVTLNQDCNQIPFCFFTKEELNFVNSSLDRPLKPNFCEPVIDITPDFKASSCFGAYELVDCKDFHDIGELRRYLVLKKMWPKEQNNISKPCTNCKYHELLQCQGGCLAFSHD